MAAGIQRFTKRERIVSQKQIDTLFSKNGSHTVAAFPVRAVYMTVARSSDTQPAVQLLVSVSKRHFKHAVDRNRVKRQLREAYRLQRHLLADHVAADSSVALALLWQSDDHYPTPQVSVCVGQLLRRIATHQPPTASQ